MTAIGADLVVQTRSAGAPAEIRRGEPGDAPMSFADMIAPGARTEAQPSPRQSRAEKADDKTPPAQRPAGKPRKADDDIVLPVTAEPAPATKQTAPTPAPAEAASDAAAEPSPTGDAQDQAAVVAASAVAPAPQPAVDAIDGAAAMPVTPPDQPATQPAPQPAPRTDQSAATTPIPADAAALPLEMMDLPAEDLARLSGSGTAPAVAVVDAPQGVNSQPAAMRVANVALLAASEEADPQDGAPATGLTDIATDTNPDTVTTAAPEAVLDGQPAAVKKDGSPTPHPAKEGAGRPVGGAASTDTADVASPQRQAFGPAKGEEKPDAAGQLATSKVDKAAAKIDAAPAREAPQTAAPPAATVASADIDLSTPASREAPPLHRHLPSQAILDQVMVHVSKAAREGMDSIRIQLRPASLGGVEVKLDVSADGRVSATVTADNQDAFDLLQRDARGLERALHEAGLKTDSGSLSFNLRGEQRPAQERAQGRGSSQRGRGAIAGIRDAAPSPRTPVSAAAGGIDIRV